MFPKLRFFIFFVTVFPLVYSSPALACDLCSIYHSIESHRQVAGTIQFGAAEQFASYASIQKTGKNLENDQNQHLNSSITQLFGSYAFSDQVAIQATLPYINRRFKRFENQEIQEGTEAGIGDMVLLAKYTPYVYRTSESVLSVQLLAGLKLPTGDSDRLGEESEEDHHDDSSDLHEDEHVEDEHSLSLKHAEHDHEESSTPSAIHGHDLALGSGSIDFPIGVSIFAQHRRTIISASMQYTFRTEGDFDYEYADDLLWDVGPAYYIAMDEDYAVALKANLSGEYKKKDDLKGETEHDTGIRSVFLGPEILMSAGPWSGEIAWDLPLDINNTGTQAVADYKLRAAITYQF